MVFLDTPNLRGVRMDEWSYEHNPHGDGKPDRHKEELYHLPTDRNLVRNLIDDPKHAGKLAVLRQELQRLTVSARLMEDRMSIHRLWVSALKSDVIDGLLRLNPPPTRSIQPHSEAGHHSR